MQDKKANVKKRKIDEDSSYKTGKWKDLKNESSDFNQGGYKAAANRYNNQYRYHSNWEEGCDNNIEQTPYQSNERQRHKGWNRGFRDQRLNRGRGYNNQRFNRDEGFVSNQGSDKEWIPYQNRRMEEDGSGPSCSQTVPWHQQRQNSKRDSFDRNQQQRDFRLSKTMSRLLRHAAFEEGIKMSSDGYVFVEDLLAYRGLNRQYTEDDVCRIVRDNDKQRFEITCDASSNRLKVRANQGHTIEVPDLGLVQIVDADEVTVVVHGTFAKSWPMIEKEGLSRMKRNHIHFAAGEPGSKSVISGMRRECEICIYIDLKRALQDGIEFYRSANNVILSTGDEHGFIRPKYFQRIFNRVTGNCLRNKMDDDDNEDESINNVCLPENIEDKKGKKKKK